MAPDSTSCDRCVLWLNPFCHTKIDKVNKPLLHKHLTNLGLIAGANASDGCCQFEAHCFLSLKTANQNSQMMRVTV